MSIVYNSISRLNESPSSVTSITFAHTCNALDTKLMIGCHQRKDITGITYNGDSASIIKTVNNIGSFTSTYQFSLYYLDNPYTGGAANIVISYSAASTYNGATATGLSGATSGIGASPNGSGNSGTATTITMNITTAVDNSHIFSEIFYNTTGAATFGDGQTEIIDNTANFGHNRLDYKTTTSAGAYTTSVKTVSAYNIGIISVELKVGTTPPPSGPSRSSIINKFRRHR